jgi:hypothetical protein
MSLAGMPIATFTKEQDINFYIADMKIYLAQFGGLPEEQKAKLVQAGVKGEVRDVMMGYTDEDVNSTQRIYKVMKREFKKREEC